MWPRSLKRWGQTGFELRGLMQYEDWESNVPGLMDIHAFCSLSIEWELFSWQYLGGSWGKGTWLERRSKFEMGTNRRGGGVKKKNNQTQKTQKTTNQNKTHLKTAPQESRKEWLKISCIVHSL